MSIIKVNARQTAGSLVMQSSSSVPLEPSFRNYVAYSIEQVAVRVSSKQSGRREQNIVTREASMFQTGQKDREKGV
jgi:hypothetical protein